MRQAMQPRPSVSEFSRRVADRSMGTWPESKLLGRTHSSSFNNHASVIGTKGGQFESSHDRIVYITTSLIGHPVEVHVKNGSILSGIFHTSSADKDFGIVLKMARIVKDGSIKGQKNVSDTAKRPQTIIVPARELVQVIAKDIPLSDEGPSNGHVPEKRQDFMIDSSISQFHPIEKRELERWIPGEDDPQCLELENIFDGNWDRNWDQFETNKALFGVKSTFNEELYTTKLERGPQTRELEREASRIAREIEGEETKDLHLAEERGVQLHGNFDLDEETRFSAVYRRVDDVTSEENMKSLLDHPNAETFGDSMHSLITNSSFDFLEREDNDVTEASTSYLQMDEETSQISAPRPAYSPNFVDKPNKLPSSYGSKNPSSDESRVDDSHYTPLDDGIFFADGNIETYVLEVQTLKHEETSGNDKGSLLSSVRAHSPSCFQENEDLEVASSEPSGSNKIAVAIQQVNSNSRPSSFMSAAPNHGGGGSVASSPGLSPSSSMGSLASEKSKLNPYAKEFKPNPKGFSQTSSLRPRSPISEGSLHYTAASAVSHVAGLPVVGMGAPFTGYPPVVYNPPAMQMQSPQAYVHPGGAVYGQQQMFFGQPRPVTPLMYMPNFPPEMPYKGRNF